MKGPVIQGVSCYVCEKQKAPGTIHPRQSKLIKGNTMLVCDTCDAEKKEPRAYIVLVARHSPAGYDKVKPYIVGRRYVGEPILAEEITVQ